MSCLNHVSSEEVIVAFTKGSILCGITYHLTFRELVLAVFKVNLADLHFNARLSIRDLCYDVNTFKLLQSILLT